MEISLRKNCVSCFHSAYSQTILLSEGQECVVPDTLPDIASVVCTGATPLIRSKDVADGRVRLEANVPARVTCLGEDGRIFPLDVNIPFYLSAQDEQISPDSVCVALLTLRQAETRLLNPRKLSVRAELAVTVTCYVENAVTTFLAPEEDGVVHTLEASAETDCVACVTEKTFILTDEASLSERLPAAAEILAQNAAACVREVKTLGSKIIVSGDVDSVLLYRCDAGALHAFSFRTEFSQIIEAGCETEGASVELQVLLSGMYYEILPGSDMRQIAMELHLVAQAVVTKAQEIAYLADAYSNQFCLDVRSETRCLVKTVDERVLEERGKLLIETAEEVSEVVFCRAEALGVETEGEEAFARLRVTLCYRCGEGYGSAERTVMQKITLPNDRGLSVRFSGIETAEIGAVPADGGAEVRYTLAIRAAFSEQREVCCIQAISYDENESLNTESLPTLILLRAGSRQSLWELAKQNCSTVEAIRAANGLDDITGEWEKLLIIPKAQ